jgi:hypothetical protein
VVGALALTGTRAVAQALSIANWSGFPGEAKPGAGQQKLDLSVDPASGSVEEIVVYGRRHPRVPDAVADGALVAAPVSLTSEEVEQGSFSGLAAKLAIAVRGVRGLEATLTAQAGNDQVNPTTTRRSAAALLGLDWHF